MSNEQKNQIAIPIKRPLTPLEEVKVALSTEYMKQVENYFAGNKDEALRFMTAAIEYVRRVPKLLKVEKLSLMTAMIQVAQFRFMPSGVMGEAYIIPYGTEAKFQLGYQGIITLLYRTKKVMAVTANIVYANDDFKYEEGLNPILEHKPGAFGQPRGEPVGVYTVAQLEGGARTFKVMDREAVMGIKALSKAKDSKDSPWNSNQDPELWMWKKTCLIQHAKTLPKTRELQQAIEADYKGEGSNKPALDPGGPAVPRAFHQLDAENFSRDLPSDKPTKAASTANDNAEPSEEEKERILASEREGK